MRDFECTIRPLLIPAAEQSFNRMMDQIQEKKNIPAEEIKFQSSAIKDPSNWEIASWSTLNLVPQSQSSEIEHPGTPPEEPEEGEIPREAAEEAAEDNIMDDLLRDLPDFYHLIPKRHFKQ